jgi:hypothetical protein
MLAEDFLQDPQIRGWLDGIEPAWTVLTFESLRALRREPSANAISAPAERASGRPTRRSYVCFALIATKLMSRNDPSRMG